MPLYEYTCPSCNAQIERVVSVTARDAQACDRLVLTSPGPCGTRLERTEIASSQVNLADRRWRVKAVLGDGRRIEGSFGMGRVRTHRGFM